MTTSVGRRVDTRDDLELPGDYTLGHMTIPTDCGRRRVERIAFLLPCHEGHPLDHTTPCSGLRIIPATQWRFRECEDGSVEVRPSILAYDGDMNEVWHGYLNEGHTWVAV